MKTHCRACGGFGVLLCFAILHLQGNCAAKGGDRVPSPEGLDVSSKSPARYHVVLDIGEPASSSRCSNACVADVDAFDPRGAPQSPRGQEREPLETQRGPCRKTLQRSPRRNLAPLSRNGTNAQLDRFALAGSTRALGLSGFALALPVMCHSPEGSGIATSSGAENGALPTASATHRLRAESLQQPQKSQSIDGRKPLPDRAPINLSEWKAIEDQRWVHQQRQQRQQRNVNSPRVNHVASSLLSSLNIDFRAIP